MGSGVAITNKEFKEKLKLINPNLILEGEYINMKTLVVIKDELNIKYLQRPQELLLGKTPSIVSCFNKNIAFKIKSNVIHNNIYNYNKVDYINARTKVIINCKIHGDWNAIPHTHIRRKQGCPICGKLSSENNRKHKGVGWNLNSWKKHGENSKLFTGYKLYVLKCWNDNECFYKIGRTYVPIKKRFEDKNKMPYKYKVMNVIINNAEIIYNLENSIKNKLKQFRYKPLIYFAGLRECFKIDIAYFADLIERLNERKPAEWSTEFINTTIDEVFNDSELET